ncbi:MAG: hypothetical protein ACRDZ4_02005 [Egibacteraceae bacterium]
MTVRHVVEADNVDEHGFVIDPTKARHCAIRAGALLDLSGPVDPLTHLNRDFPDHALGDCVVAERLAPGAPVLLEPTGRFLVASTRPEALRRLRQVDVDARRIAWLQVHRRRREQALDAP